MVVVVVVVLYWVNLAKPEQCFPESASPYGSGLGWGTGKMCTRFGACKGSSSHVYTRKVNVKSGDAGAQAPRPASASSPCQHDKATRAAAVPAGSCCFSSSRTKCVLAP